MRDVQKEPDNRNIPINKVGVKGIRYPIIVLDRKNGTQPTVASVNMYVDLPHTLKGTHMSRFVEILNRHHGRISIKNMKNILEEMRQSLNAECSHIAFEFPYFIEKEAPVSGSKGLMEYTAEFIGNITLDSPIDFILGVKVPVTTVCPCSREISNMGAHNQRSVIIIRVRFNKVVWIEDLVRIAEDAASSPIYSIVKRDDEKYMTEHAYNNPRFVEDVVRGIAEVLAANENILWFTVESENFESIHNHSAYAFIEKDKL